MSEKTLAALVRLGRLRWWSALFLLSDIPDDFRIKTDGVRFKVEGLFRFLFWREWRDVRLFQQSGWILPEYYASKDLALTTLKRIQEERERRLQAARWRVLAPEELTFKKPGEK